MQASLTLTRLSPEALPGRVVRCKALIAVAAPLHPLSRGRAGPWARASHNGNGVHAAPEPAPVLVRFHIPYRAEMGDHLAVVGAGDFLGNWQVDRRLPLQWHEGDEWAGDLEVPSGSTLEYKYIVVRRDGAVEWSPGNNNLLEVAHSRQLGCTMDVRELWVDGPRHVSISEPEPERAATSAGPPAATLNGASAADVVSGAASKLQGAAERLARVEWEAAVVGLLSQYPLMPPDRIYKAMQALKPKRPDLELDELQDLLAQMVREEKLVELGGRYRLHATHHVAAGRAPTRPPAAATGPGATGSVVGQQQQRQHEPPTLAQLVPAVMRLLESYSSMSLDRMLRALSSAGPEEVRGVGEAQLSEALAQLTAERRVLQGPDGQFRKGLATPSASRRAATPSASRRASSAGSPSPGPSAAALQGHHRVPTSSPSTPAAAAARSRPPMTADQLSAFEQRTLSLLSNYSGCTAERIHAQLKATSDFPGTAQDALWLLRTLVGEGRVKEASGGIFIYQSTRQATPAGARGPSTPRAASPAPRHAPATPSGGLGTPRRPASASSASSSSGAFQGGSASARSSLPSHSRTPSPGTSRPSVAVASSATATWAFPTTASEPAMGGHAHRPAEAPTGTAAAPRPPSPAAVRRHLSAYSMFCAERRDRVRASVPRGTSYSELSRVLAAEWEAAPEAVRRRYEAAAERDRQRYEAEVGQYEREDAEGWFAGEERMRHC